MLHQKGCTQYSCHIFGASGKNGEKTATQHLWQQQQQISRELYCSCHLSAQPLILRRQNLWWVSVAGRWTGRPSAMSTFGEILAHLGTVIMGVRHIGHGTFCVHFGTPHLGPASLVHTRYPIYPRYAIYVPNIPDRMGFLAKYVQCVNLVHLGSTRFQPVWYTRQIIHTRDTPCVH